MNKNELDHYWGMFASPLYREAFIRKIEKSKQVKILKGVDQYIEALKEEELR